MWLGERALAKELWPPSPVILLQTPPCSCQVPMPGYAPEPPNTQTFAGLNAVTPVSSRGRPDSRQRRATVHRPFCQCKTYPPRLLVVQASVLESALTADSVLVMWRGIASACQRPICQRATTG